MLLGLLFLVSAGAAEALTDGERAALVDMVACPFIAAQIKSGDLTPESGEWTRDEAKALFDHYMDPVFGDGLFGGMAQATGRNAIMVAFFGISGDKSPMPWTSVDYLHATHTGIRLANITGQPDVWKLPCDKTGLGTWSMDSSCGEPGPHPEVFDHYAALLNKGENDTWESDELKGMCDQASDLNYVEGQEHPTGGVGSFLGSSGCKGVYGAAASAFGPITTKEWRTFLTNATLPASWVVAAATRVTANLAPKLTASTLLLTALLSMTFLHAGREAHP